MTTGRSRSRRLTPDEVAEIIERKLRGESHRSVAAVLDVNVNTVTARWNKWREEQGRLHDKDIVRARGEALARLAQIANDARALLDDSVTDPVRALAEERQALMSLAKLTGLDINRHELTGADGGPVQIDVTTLTDEELDKLAGD